MGQALKIWAQAEPKPWTSNPGWAQALQKYFEPELGPGRARALIL